MKAIPKLPDAVELEFSDEEKRRAELALQEVDDLADKLAGQSLQFDRDYRALFGAMPGENRDKIIWRGIIGFANAANFDSDAPDSSSAKLVLAEIKKFFQLLMFCGPSGTVEKTGVDFLESFADVRAFAKGLRNMDPSISSSLVEIASFNSLCLKYQPQLKKFLTWLCAPQQHRDLRSEAINFLGKHARGVDVIPDFSDANLKRGKDYCPVYYYKEVHCQSLMGPICKFIFDRIERYHDWLDQSPQYSRKKFKETEDEEESERENAVPIRMCERPGCGKFLVPQRVGRKRFCSKTCLVLDQPGRTGDENRDYMRLYRLEKLKLPVLRVKLKSQAKEQWLAKIENDWPDLADRVKKLRQRVR
jgi:hypothetical protein